MRHWLQTRKAEGEFQRNLADWRRGGPAEQGGWTRSGPPIKTPDCTLGSVRRELVAAEECFAKNTAEVKRWHIAFLETLRSRGDLYGTAYWSEYLLPRFPR